MEKLNILFDTNRMNELVGGGDEQTQRDIAAVQTVKEKGLNVDEVPEDLMNALTKDYREVLKKSEEMQNLSGKSAQDRRARRQAAPRPLNEMEA